MGVGAGGDEGGEGGALDGLGGLGDLEIRGLSVEDGGTEGKMVERGKGVVTGVRSRSESASLAEVAASMRSSHRFPIADAGSAESAFRPSILSLRACSLDMPLPCFGRRSFLVMEDLRGLAGLSLLWMGGSVDDRPGGERDIIDGRSSRGLGEWNGGMGSWLMWLWIGGSSTEECMCGRRRTSWSDNGSCARHRCQYFAIGGRHRSDKYAIQFPIPSLSLAGGCGVEQGPRRP